MSENKNSYATITDIPAAMEFGEFVETMRERIQEQYPGCEVKITPVAKNNDVCRTGILILPEGRAVSPNIYMEEPYEEYLGGSSVEELVSEYIRLYEESAMEKEPAIPDITGFNAVKDTICIKLVNRERNRENLKGMPHRDFLDLAVTYFIPVTVDDSHDGRIAVTDRLSSLWGVDVDTLHGYAMENTKRLFPVSLTSLEELIWEMTGIRPKERTPVADMHVLYRGYRGNSTAAVLLDTPVLQKFAEEHGDFYILPSSIYEVILVPAGPGPADTKYYSGMVRDVNRTSLSPDEILSDNAYYYHAGTGEIEILS